jgi:hypothetical protein
VSAASWLPQLWREKSDPYVSLWLEEAVSAEEVSSLGG